MTELLSSSPAAALRAARARLLGEAGERSLVATWPALAALVVVSAAVRGFWAARVPSPWINGDEAIYAELGRSLWYTGHLDILGAPTRFYGLIYPALVGGPLSLPDPETGHLLLKWLQALVMSLTAVPVYLWGRSLASRGWALAAAALTLAVPGLAYSGLIMTEVAFYPVLVLAAWAMARALETPSLTTQGLVLAMIAAAALTRLQALVLVPAYLTAVVIKILLDRDGPRALARHVPALGGLALMAGGWSTWQISRGGGNASDALGAYRAAGEVSYDLGEAAKYVAYHAADVVLLTAVVPACAVGLLFLTALRGAERSPAVRAYLAVTVALTAWFVVEVGVFASRLVGTLAERNLFALAPLYFLGLAVWLHRGAPRERLPSILVAGAAIALVAALPVRALLTGDSLHQTFTLIPFYDLGERSANANLRILTLDAVLALIALAALVPRRRLWVLPAVLVALFAALSIFATRAMISYARSSQTQLIGGPDRRWADRAAAGPIVFLTGGEASWPAVYANIFWNREIRRVYTLPGFAVPGPLPQTPVGPQRDGKIVFAHARPAPAQFVIASNTLTLFGTKLAAPRKAKLALWRVRHPLRMSTWLTGLGIVRTDADAHGNLVVAGSMAADAKVVVYDCSGVFRLSLAALGDATSTSIEVRRNGAVVRRATIPAWHGWTATIPARGLRAECDLEILSSSRMDVKRLELDRG